MQKLEIPVRHAYGARALHPSQSQGACAPCDSSPMGGAKIRPWTKGNLAVRQTFLNLCLTASFAAVDDGDLAPPVGELARSA